MDTHWTPARHQKVSYAPQALSDLDIILIELIRTLIKMDNTVINITGNFVCRSFSPVLDEVAHLMPKLSTEPKRVIFDLSDSAYVGPEGILLIKRLADDFKAIGCQCAARFPSQEKGLARWLCSIMGLTGNTQPVNAYLDSIRVPLQRCMNSTEILESVNKKLLPLIQQKFKMDESALKALNWALWEIIDNAGVHGYKSYGRELHTSYPKPLYFCAFDFNESVTIAMLDSGQGIQKSFLGSGKDKYRGITNERAMELAIREGESGHPEGSPGFGLYGCAQFGRLEKGSLQVMSGANRMRLDADGMKIYNTSYYDGTIVTLDLKKTITIEMLKSILGETSATLEAVSSFIGGFDE